MDTDLLKCNRMTCRRALTDKAVVTTCSHIFCVDCANELFNAARLCPACETTLTEPDDVVVCSLHPTNDYKTSVLSGLSPSNVLEICSRAISFWQYQIHQENSFQHAVVRNINDKNAQMQKQLDNVIREANGEINLLNGKLAGAEKSHLREELTRMDCSELETDLELERRKVRDMHEASRERDKEYQKLKAQHDKIKRKALLGGTPMNEQVQQNFGGNFGHAGVRQNQEEPHSHGRASMAFGSNAVDLGAVVGGMEANGIQRTPIGAQKNAAWIHPQQNQGPQGQLERNNVQRRHTFNAPADRAFQSISVSERSESADEVENLLLNTRQVPSSVRRPSCQAGWGTANQGLRTQQRVFAPTVVKRASGSFRPAGQPR